MVLRKCIEVQDNKAESLLVQNSAFDSNGDSLLKEVFCILKQVKKSYPKEMMDKLVEWLDSKYFEGKKSFELIDYEYVNYLTEIITGLLPSTIESSKYLSHP